MLGTFVSDHPGKRLTLLLRGGAVLLVVWFVVTVALWELDDATAAIVTVVVLALTALIVGWAITHQWNREVILFAEGFSYREGSRIVFIRYDEIRTIRQRGERRSYFGGLVRRDLLSMTITTIRDEVIRLDNIYQRIDVLMTLLERDFTRTVRPVVEKRIAAGERIRFGEGLALDSNGLHDDAGRLLTWGDFAGHRIERGGLVIDDGGGEWLRVSLSEADNLRLLLDILESHQGTQDA